MSRLQSPGTVAVAGSANMDLVVRCEQLPQPGQTLLGRSFTVSTGGKGANQAIAIGCLGRDVEFVGKLGVDDYGNQLMLALEAASVGTDSILRTKLVPSGVALIFVSESGENMIVVAQGANRELTPHEIDLALKAVRPSVTLAQLEIPIESVKACIGHGRFVLNPAPARDLPEDLLSRVDVLTPNESETEAITGVAPIDPGSCETAARRLLDRGVQAVVLTLGKRGSFVCTRSMSVFLTALDVKPVDTTAAGDAFNGALASFLAEGRDLVNAAALANCVAALSTTRPGAGASMPSDEELRTVAGALL